MASEESKEWVKGMPLHDILSILRNPYGRSEVDVRQAMLEAAERLETVDGSFVDPYADPKVLEEIASERKRNEDINITLHTHADAWRLNEDEVMFLAYKALSNPK